MKDVNLIVSVIALNGGMVVGKTRLQKIVYLLTRCGMDSEFEFDYHNYGPFSAGLARATDFAQIGGRVQVEERPGFHQVPYSVFTTQEPQPKRVGGLSAAKVAKLLGEMENYSAIELELAATMAYLDECDIPRDKIDDVLRSLKPGKATNERLVNAHQLLLQIGLLT